VNQRHVSQSAKMAENRVHWRRLPRHVADPLKVHGAWHDKVTQGQKCNK